MIFFVFLIVIIFCFVFLNIYDKLVTMNTRNLQIVISKCGLKEQELFGEISKSRSGEGNI